MTIRSVDIQVLVQKTGEVARVQQTHQADSTNRQIEFNQAIVDQTQKNTRSVNQPARNESAHVNEKQDKQKKEKKEETKKGKSSILTNNVNNKPDGSKENNHLDIIV